MYLVHHDEVGRRFRDLLAVKAREGVTVRVLYDWFGSLRLLGSGMWKPVLAAGGDVRVANPPALDSGLGWLTRDHRKLLAIDGAEAFVSGLCIGDAWIGDPARGVAPWRDTGVQFSGPAVADAEAAFAAAWEMAGPPIPPATLPRREDIPAAGPVALRVIASTPETAGLYRLDLMVAAVARWTLWLTDAYFIATPGYLQSLRAAAQHGVDVRLLVPHGSDIEWIARLSRTMYRSLLEAGVRVFEWNGPMMHAKTAVADGRWTRIGSTNLNLSSWMGNWELDVAIEDAAIARQMEQIFLEDLAGSTEIVIAERHRMRPTRPRPPGPQGRTAAGSSTRVLSDMTRVGGALGAAVAGHRTLGRGESASLFLASGFLLVLALLMIFLPRVLTYPLALVLVWTGLVVLVKAARLRFGRKPAGDSPD
jgi:phosphatidylserine/phosphatidylglycerophosphate/cardiolipin synthase-like enzyme